MKSDLRYYLSGPRLRQMRDQSTFTQTEVAERAGLRQQQYADIERAERSNPTLDTVCRIAEALRCKIDDLVMRT